MRSSRTAKSRSRKIYIKAVLWTFLVAIPLMAVISSVMLHMAIQKDKSISASLNLLPTGNQETNAFKYSFDINAKILYRVEIKKFDRYEDAEAQINILKNKKLNGFIVKESGYLAAYGVFSDQSQADTALQYLKRNKISGDVKEISISAFAMNYADHDKNLVDLATATDTVIYKLISEKSVLSLECLYSDKTVSDSGLEAIIEYETRLERYLNLLQNLKTSEKNAYFREELEELLNEVLVDRIERQESYDYYKLQNSLMNQMESIRKFYEKLIV